MSRRAGLSLRISGCWDVGRQRELRKPKVPSVAPTELSRLVALLYAPKLMSQVLRLHGSGRLVVSPSSLPLLSWAGCQHREECCTGRGANEPSFPGCENAQLVSALSSEDQGTVNILNNLFNIPDADLINAAFGNQGFDANDTASGIPSIGTGSDNGPESCRAKCAAQTNGTS